MRQLSVGLLLVLFLLAPLTLQAESAGSLYKKGKDAEAAQKYETAYDLYKQAYDKDPKDIRYRTATERTRFYAAAVKVHRGQLLREGGRLEEALAQFEAAAAIDPSMDIAQQELRLTRRLLGEAKQQPPSAQNEQQSQGPLSALLQQAQGPTELQPISDQGITLKMIEDTKMVYETIGKLAGINVLFDPELQSRRIRIELNGVSLQDALQIVAFESKTFWRPVTSNTIFIAADNQGKRRELEQSVIKTFYLSNVSQPTDLSEILQTLRQVVGTELKLQQFAAQNAIVVRGTPDQVALTEKVIDDLDKPKPEVVVDVAIMQVNRDRSRDLGLKPPTSATVALQGVNTTTTPATTGSTTSTTTTPATTSTTSTGSGLTFNTFKHLGSSSYSVTIPGATASFLFSDSDSRIIQNPQLRAVNGQKATLKIGDRVPVASGSFGNPFQGSSAAGNFSGLVNTQFQYLDVGVKVEITPTIHANREVTLKVALDVSSVTSQADIGGIKQPIIGQRTIDNEIRLKEGEINIMGGIFEEQDVKSWSGIPGLGQIPLFRYLFASQGTRKVENEIVFVLIPHIVRTQEVTPLNNLILEVGTAQNTVLRRSGVKSPASPPTQQAPQQQSIQPQAAPPATNPPRAMGVMNVPETQPAANAVGTQPSSTASPPPMPSTAPPTGPESRPAQENVQTAQATPPQDASAGAPARTRALPQNPTGDSAATAQAAAVPLVTGKAEVRLDPPVITQAAGTTAAINVMLDSAAPVHDFSIELKYDPNAMQLLNVTNGGYLSRDGQNATEVHRAENGVLHAGVIRSPSAPGIPGQGAVLTLMFLLKKPGEYVLAPNVVVPKNSNGVIPVNLAGQTAIRILSVPQR